MTKPQIDHNTTVGTADMAQTIGVTPRRLQQLAAEGWVEGKIGRDRWNLFRVVQTYLSYCRSAGRA